MLGGLGRYPRFTFFPRAQDMGFAEAPTREISPALNFSDFFPEIKRDRTFLFVFRCTPSRNIQTIYIKFLSFNKVRETYL
jgi:hypothetical protein